MSDEFKIEMPSNPQPTVVGLTEEQELALKKAIFWYNIGDGKNYHRIVGYAGVGKTFIVKYIIKELGLNYSQVAFCAFTGNAAFNLVKKGNKNAKTIHRLIYQTIAREEPILNNKGEVIGYETILETTKKSALEDDVKLIILDEYSMATDEHINDLLSFKVKVIMLGDPEQLPPVGSPNTYMSEYESIITEIVRQGKDSEIITQSFNARNKIAIPYGVYGNKEVIVIPDYFLEDTTKYYEWASQIICGKNATRSYINNTCREIKGFRSMLPSEGDKVVCLENNKHRSAYSYKLGSNIELVNGTMGYCKRIVSIDTAKKEFRMDFVTDFDPECIFYDVPVMFKNFDPNITYLRRDQYKHDLANMPIEFDFGYALTCHKTQGNQYPKVLVVAERLFWDREKKLYDIDLEKKWLYTAITRAESKLVIAIPQDYYKDKRYEKSALFKETFKQYF